MVKTDDTAEHLREPVSETKRKSQHPPAGCILAFGCLFFLAGLAAFGFTFVKPFLLQLSAASWPETSCRVLSAELTEHAGDDSSTWEASFTYEYFVDQQRYVGNRDDPFSASGSRKAAKARLRELPVGKETVCYYDPGDPTSSLLRRSASSGTILFSFFFPMVFVGVGGGILGYGFFIGRSKRKKRFAEAPQKGHSLPPIQRSYSENLEPDQQRPDVENLQDLSNDSALADSENNADAKDARFAPPQRLKPASSRIGRFIGMFFITLFWNGIISLLVFGIFFDQQPGNVWVVTGVTLFMIPFVLVGLFLLFATLHSLVGLFNPRVSLALSSGAIARGGTVDIAWESAGGLRKIQRLKIYVAGTEWARYMRGTSQIRDESTFALIPVCDTDQRDEIRFGSSSVSIPASTMHTFHADNNGIKWKVCVRGEIAFWPDVDEEFLFRVTPATTGRTSFERAENDLEH